jgi:TonB family protein
MPCSFALRRVQFVQLLLIVGSLLLIEGHSIRVEAQDKNQKQTVDAKNFPKRCNPIVVNKGKVSPGEIHIRKGDKPTGFTPLIAFGITEVGEVIDAHVKRSSGIREVDGAALNWIRSTKYNSRPGCPVIDNETNVLIDYQ